MRTFPLLGSEEHEYRRASIPSVMNRLSEATTLMRQSWLRRLMLAMLLIPVFRPEGVGSQDADFPLNVAEVGALVRATAEAVDSPGLAAAIVDRGGRILAIYARPAASPLAPDTAVTIARAAAMFSNGDAPISARTVRYISGVHFPPGVPNTPNAALYGIENTNRGCQLNAGDTAPIERPRSIAGSGLAGPALACLPGDTRGCARGEPLVIDPITSTTFRGFSTGKNDVRDTPGADGVNVTPGGFAVYRNGAVVGAVGVADAAGCRRIRGVRRRGRHRRDDRPLAVAGQPVAATGRRLSRRAAAAVLRHVHQRPVRTGPDQRWTSRRVTRNVSADRSACDAAGWSAGA